MHDKRLIIFDCDGVLVDSEMIISKHLVTALSQYDYHISVEEWLKRFLGKTDKYIYQEINDDLKAMRLTENIVLNIQKEVNEKLQRELQAVRGMHEILERLRANKEEICVASSGTLEKVNTSLSVTKLKQFFSKEQIFSAHSVEHGKPAPDLFLLAAKQMGSIAKNCLVIEDTIPGIEAAKNAKMKVVGFLGGSHASYSWYANNIKACKIPTVADAQELASLLHV
jgi:HAD superfamily hydrolase (TIGR01509 family)